MSNEKIWPGSGSAITTGSTPFGFYDTESQFQQDAPRVAHWCATRLGYPIQNIELIDINFYACFEESITEYSSQVNQFNIRNNLDSVQGRPTSETLTQKLIEGTNLQFLVELSNSYGTLAGVGGMTDIKKGNIDLERGVQYYDLQKLVGDEEEGGKRLVIHRVFYEEPPAISRFFDPFAITGVGTQNMMDGFGFGGFSPATQFVLMPLYEDLLRLQAIEFNDQIRKSTYSFNIVNNKLQLFPIPTGPNKLWFEYFISDDYIDGQIKVSDNVTSDYSNINYSNISYSSINDVGKQWIRKYTLALTKELLGAIREKYSTIPIPDSEISLDGASLRSEASEEKSQLIEQLRENLEELSKKNRMEQRSQEAEYHQEMLKKIPTLIYVG